MKQETSRMLLGAAIGALVAGGGSYMALAINSATRTDLVDAVAAERLYLEGVVTSERTLTNTQLEAVRGDLGRMEANLSETGRLLQEQTMLGAKQDVRIESLLEAVADLAENR